MWLAHPLAPWGPPAAAAGFFSLWFFLDACKAGEWCFISCQRPIPIPSVLLPQGRLAQRGAYLEAPEPPDVPSPLETGGYQPLIQAAFQGTQARGASPDDGYSLCNHVLRCGSGRDAREASARDKTRSGECGAWRVTLRGRAVLYCWEGYPCASRGRLRLAGVSQDVFLPDMIYWFPPPLCHTSCPHPPSRRGSLSSVSA